MIYFADAVYEDGKLEWLIYGQGQKDSSYAISASTDDPNPTTFVTTHGGLQYEDGRFRPVAENIEIYVDTIYKEEDVAQKTILKLLFGGYDG